MLPQNSKSVFAGVPDTEKKNHLALYLVSQLVVTNQKSSDFTRRELIQPFTKARMLDEFFGCCSQVLSRTRRRGCIHRGQKIMKAAEIGHRF